MTVKKFGLTAVVASGLAAAILGVAAPMQAVASADAPPVLELPGYSSVPDHHQSVEVVYPQVTVPQSR